MDSTADQSSEGIALVRVLATVLERLVETNAQLGKDNLGNITKFHALKAPAISILNYLERIHKYSSCSIECFVFALIYIDRLIQRTNFILTELNVHRVIITAVLLAAKFYDDSYYNNAYYAKVGGVPVSEMNGLELEFLFFIQFSLHATPEVFIKYRSELISHATWACLEQPAHFSTIIQHSHPPSPQLASSQSSSSVACCASYPVHDMIRSSESSQCDIDVEPKCNNQEIINTCMSRITPSPPSTSRHVSPPLEFSDQEQAHNLLHDQSITIYSAPARYSGHSDQLLYPVLPRRNSCPLTGKEALVQRYPTTNEFASSTSSSTVISNYPRCDVEDDTRKRFAPMAPYSRMVTEENSINCPSGSIPYHDSTEVVGSDCYKIPLGTCKPARYDRCVSMALSPSTSSPHRFVDAISSTRC